jgi:hypothetical protein
MYSKSSEDSDRDFAMIRSSIDLLSGNGDARATQALLRRATRKILMLKVWLVERATYLNLKGRRGAKF